MKTLILKYLAWKERNRRANNDYLIFWQLKYNH
jgi:hypothetical protein